MKKAIQLIVTLWIEGEDAPSHDYASMTRKVISDILSSGARKYPDLSISIRKIGEETDMDDDDEMKDGREKIP